jgi:NAD(P)-dependent dehydrogenase (short-subunit alcohol dehydrogenase family)
VDICCPLDGVSYPMATKEDLAETVTEVEALDRRTVATEADVRDVAALKAVVADGVAQLGGVDIVLANAGIAVFDPALPWLVPGEARYVTGVALPVDAGFLAK